MTLSEELALPEYAGMTPRQAADHVNAKTVPVVVPECFIGYGSVMEALGATAGGSLLNTLEALAVSTPSLKWAMKLLDRGMLDMGNPETRAQVSALCAGGVMTAAQRDALLALGEAPGPYAATLGFDRPIDPQDIIEAGG